MSAATLARATAAITVPGSDLKAAAAWVARALPQRPAVPVLGALTLATDNTGQLYLSAFDYTIHATVTVPFDGDPLPGTVLVSGQMFTNITARLNGQATLTLDEEGRTLTVEAGRSRFRLATIATDDYPTVPDPAPTDATVDASTLTRVLTAAAAATARVDKGDLNLTSVRIVAEAGQLTVYGTDRYRAVKATTVWNGPDMACVLIADHLLDATKGMVGQVRAGANEDRFTATAQDRTFTLNAQAGQYPAIERFFTQATTATVEVVIDQGHLLDALADARLGVEQNMPVSLTFGDRVLTVAATKTGGELAATTTIPITGDGGGLEYRINPEYLADQVKHCPTSHVHLTITNPNKPMTIRPTNDAGQPSDTYTAVVMPLRGESR